MILSLSWLSMAGCASWVHQMDVQQGNILTQEMISRLQIGMDKQQVRHILGTPSIINSFQPQRWYYVYTHKTGTKNAPQSTVVLDFTGERLEKIDGDIQQLPLDAAAKEKVIIVPTQKNTSKHFWNGWFN